MPHAGGLDFTRIRFVRELEKGEPGRPKDCVAKWEVSNFLEVRIEYLRNGSGHSSSSSISPPFSGVELRCNTTAPFTYTSFVLGLLTDHLLIVPR